MRDSSSPAAPRNDRLRRFFRNLLEPFHRRASVAGALLLGIGIFWSFLGPASLRAGDGKVALSRKYRAGQRVVYQTNMQVRATVESNPPGLKSFLPPVPTRITARQQNTVTVRKVHSDGSAEVETRFDTFEFESDLVERLPESTRDSARTAQQEFRNQVTGQTLKVRYDRAGKLVSFEGADRMLQQLDPPLREPLKQVLRLFLEQIGGDTLYPDHPVKPGEGWTRKLSTQPSAEYPFAMQGESTLQYAGKTRYRGVKAAIIDFKFTNVLWPELAGLRKAGPLAQLESSGLGLDIRIDGTGNGRVLVALKDGRVLQNHSTLHQDMSASLKGKAPGAAAPSEPVTLQIKSETALEMEGVPR